MLRFFFKSSFSFSILHARCFKTIPIRGTYKRLSNKDIQFFQSIIPNHVKSDDVTLSAVNTDWLKSHIGRCQLVLEPGCVEEISQILKYCNSEKIAICIQGGLTSLVAGSVPIHDEIVLSTRRMNRVFNVDETSSIITCEAGCVLQSLNDHLEKYNLMMPHDLGAKGSCMIGGNVATNAGGIRLLRYGSLHGSVLGLEIVLPNGQIVNLLNSLKKDNTGFDLKHLFIGSEGSLGVITKIAILCPTKPSAVEVSLLRCASFQDILEILRFAKKDLNEILTAFEFMDCSSSRVIEENLQLKFPFDIKSNDGSFYTLIETGCSSLEYGKIRLEKFLEKLFKENIITDGVIAQDSSQAAHIWGLRERLAEALLHDGYCYKYDISLPPDKMYELVEKIRKRLSNLKNVVRIVGYGHVGDGNLHLNVTTKTYDTVVHKIIEPFVYEWTSKHHGSISAEHGIGRSKLPYLSYSKSKEAIELMIQLKNLLDPNLILNPYKTIPIWTV